MVEGRTNTVTLPNDDPAAFACVVNWLYTGKVELTTLEECIKAYILADKLMIQGGMQAEVVSAMLTAKDKDEIELRHVLMVVDCGLVESEMMSVVIKLLAKACKGDWKRLSGDGDGEKAHEWMDLLGKEPGLTMRVLESLKGAWEYKSSGSWYSTAIVAGGRQHVPEQSALYVLSDPSKEPRRLRVTHRAAPAGAPKRKRTE
jgi:hypothetical protein